MLDAAVEAGEEGGGLVGDDGSFEVGASEGADGFEGTPDSFDDDFNFAFEASSANRDAEIAGNAAKFGKDIFGKVLEILRQKSFGGASGPAAQNGSGRGNRRGGRRFVADDYIPLADFPFFDKPVLDVRVVARERFDFGFVVHVENDQGAVGRFGKGAGKNNFATFTSLVCKAQVLLAEWRAAGDKVIDTS
jgi:hypothetical protein